MYIEDLLQITTSVSSYSKSITGTITNPAPFHNPTANRVDVYMKITWFLSDLAENCPLSQNFFIQSEPKLPRSVNSGLNSVKLFVLKNFKRKL